VSRRDGPEQGFPAWRLWPGLDDADPDASPLLAALDARAGRLLALDQAAGEAVWIAETGEVLDRWSLRTSGVGAGGAAGDVAGEAALAIDVALGHERAYLAFGGRGLVHVRDLDGAVAATWPTRDAVRAIAAGRGPGSSGDPSGGAGGRAADGPGDDLFVLGRDGWVFRHHPDGRLVAAWPLPDRDVAATDIAVDAAGRVMVSWARLAPARDQLEQRSTPLRGAGIWLFEPDPAAVGPPPRQESRPEACTFLPDKRAAPARLPLGDEVRIELSLSGRCPDRPVPLELVLLLDSSGSMASGEANARARDAAMTVLAGLDPAFARVALVRFAAEARVLRPLGVDVASVAGDLSRQRPEGASNLAAGLREAASVLAQPPATSDTRRMVLLLSDGAVAEDEALWPARDALREQGVALHALVFSNEALDYRHRLTLRQLLVEPERQLSDPSRATLERWLGGQVLRTPTRGLIERLTITDDLPPDMDYVVDSARPAAVWDPDLRRLTWTLAARPGQPPLGAPSLSYRVLPRRAGQRPTNVAAVAELSDARGQPARLVFPVPVVEVLPPRFTAWLPLLARAACLRRPPPLDLVVVLDTSRSMDQPAGGGEPGHTRLEAARGAVRLLAETLDARTRADDRASGPVADPAAAHRLAVVTFDAQARVAVPLVTDPARVRLGLAGLATASGTRIDAGLHAAGELLGKRGRDSRPVVLLLTDGRPDGGASGAAAARAAAATLDARRITLAFGPSPAVDLELLRVLATRPEDAFHAPSEAQLRTLASSLVGRLTCPEGAP
jgi:Mg-chelatase subunit ChlD